MDSNIGVSIVKVLIIGTFVAWLIIRNNKKDKETEKSTIQPDIIIEDNKKPYISIVEYDRKEIKLLSEQLLSKHIYSSITQKELLNYHHIVNLIINNCEEKNIPYTTEKVNDIFLEILNSELYSKLFEETAKKLAIEDEKMMKQEDEKMMKQQEEKQKRWEDEKLRREKEREEIIKREIQIFTDFKNIVSQEIDEIIEYTSYLELQEHFEEIVSYRITLLKAKHKTSEMLSFFNNYEKELENFTKDYLTTSITLKKNLLMLHSPLYDYFNAVEGGETTLYYLKLNNKFNEVRYKIGVTLQDVKTRYKGINHPFMVLYEKKLTHANTIEKQILQEFQHLVTDESLLGTTGCEILKEDVLKLDK